MKLNHSALAQAVLVLLLFTLVTPLAADPRKRKITEILPEEGWRVPELVSQSERKWFAFDGEYCRVETTSSLQAAEDIAAFADRYLAEFRTIFRGGFKINRSLTMRVFSYEKEFKERYRSVTGHDMLRPAVYLVSSEETWVLLDGKGPMKKLPIETCKHEFTHHMLHYFTGNPRLPHWFNEGAACFFQYWNIDDSASKNVKKNLVRAQSGYYGYFPQVIAAEFGGPDFLSAERLMNLNYQAFHTKVQRLENLYYSESWALFNFFASTKTGKRYLSDILEALRDQRDAKSVFDQNDFESLEKAWAKDIRKRLIPSVEKGIEKKEQAARKEGGKNQIGLLGDDVLEQEHTGSEPHFRLSIAKPKGLRKQFRFVDRKVRMNHQLEELDKQLKQAEASGNQQQVEWYQTERERVRESWESPGLIVERLGDENTRTLVRVYPATSDEKIEDVGYHVNLTGPDWDVTKMLASAETTTAKERKAGQSSYEVEFVGSYRKWRRTWYRVRTVLVYSKDKSSRYRIELLQFTPAHRIGWQDGVRPTSKEKRARRDLNAILDRFEVLSGE